MLPARTGRVNVPRLQLEHQCGISLNSPDKLPRILQNVLHGSAAVTLTTPGVVALLVGTLYCIVVLQGGRWRLYFPLAAGNSAAVGRDLGGLLHGRVPAAEGGGLFGAIEGLLLLALLTTGLSGVVWYLLQGSDAALTWRVLHIIFARVLVAAGLAHLLAVGAHLLEFVRD